MKIIMKNIIKLSIRALISFSCGAIILCIFATFQKMAIEASLTIRGYYVPLLFGGMSGLIIGMYVIKVRDLNTRLNERINTLEKFLPICANCKKIRKTDSDPENPDSWQQIESYISERTTSQFTHSICPECSEKLYGNIKGTNSGG